jgi:phosphatidylserine/phosphatidylglycerophosphate/cardiolipin synthase-like enzyme
MKVLQSKNGVSVAAYQGDAMTLLAFDLEKNKTTNFTGFSIRVTPPGLQPYFLFNRLSYPATVTYPGSVKNANLITTEFAPIQKFRWVHVPATNHNIDSYVFGNYTYEISARYLVNNELQPIDPTLTITIAIPVCPFKTKALEIGFTRSFIASQAFVQNFGDTVTLRPKTGQPGYGQLIFDTKLNAGSVTKAIKGVDKVYSYSYEELHEWLGWQARQRIFDFLDEVLKDPAISLDVFAFDLDEPVISNQLLTLAEQDRIRVILDNSSTHTGKTSAGIIQFEDQFETLFNTRATGKTNAKIIRGHFQSLAHSKVFIQKKDGAAIKVLTGSTNFSTNGLYVNANNVLIFTDTHVATLYESVFEASFTGMASFKNSTWASTAFGFNSPAETNNTTDTDVPEMVIRVSPHPLVFATAELDGMAEQVLNATSNVLFAIMDDKSKSPLLAAILKQVESNATFTYGITDTSTLVLLYKPDSKTGIHVTGKGLNQKLPPPFDTEPAIPGISIHHKFVVVDFNTDNGVVFCGSSNLALGPEQANGDNLLEIRDKDVVTAFAIEAIRLVDHFQFRDKSNTASSSSTPLILHTDSAWVAPYYDPADLLFKERTLLVSHQ